MPTPTDIARAAAGAFIGKIWGQCLTHGDHGALLTAYLLETAKEIKAEKDRQRRGRKVKDTQADSTFKVFWDAYAKKTGRAKCLLKWRRLSAKARQRIMEHVPHYVEATPDPEFRKNPLTYLNGAYWLDEVPPSNGEVGSLLTHAEAVKALDQYGSATRLEDLFLIVREPDSKRVMFQRKS